MMEIVYFGNDWFGENKTSSHHIAERFSLENKILYVECPGLRMPKRTTRDFKKFIKKIISCLMKPRAIGREFWIYTLFQIPLHKYALIRKVNEKIILFLLNRALKKLGFVNPILWFHIPHLFMIPGKINCKGIVYYCIDNYSALPDVNCNAVQFMDDEMTRKADLVFVVSKPLFNKKKDIVKNLFLSPHGVDFDHFNQSIKYSLPIPSDVEGISHPIIGFWGLIESRIDLELIAYIAKRRTEWNFILIGYLEQKENVCSDLTNVHFIGQKKFADLPYYAKIFDVTMLPYKMDDFFFNCNPLKLREYLATGKPVVTMRNPEVEKYHDIVSIADNYDDFIIKISWCLENDSTKLSEQRVDRMRSESWDQRVNEILKTINLNLV